MFSWYYKKNFFEEELILCQNLRYGTRTLHSTFRTILYDLDVYTSVRIFGVCCFARFFAFFTSITVRSPSNRDRQKAPAYISNTLGHGTKHIKDMENVCSSSRRCWFQGVDPFGSMFALRSSRGGSERRPRRRVQISSCLAELVALEV